MAYDAIIIGAGMSGLAAGIRLAMFDKKVLILERHYLPSGLNSYYHRLKRPFDVGLHAMTNYVPKNARGAPLTKLLRQLRISHDALRLAPQHGSEVRFPSARLAFTNDFEVLRQSVREVFPAQIDGFDRLTRFIHEYDDLSLDAAPRPSRPVLEEYLSDPLLIDMLYCPLMYYGSAEADEMELGQFCIMFKSIFSEGFARPEGGVRTIVKLLADKYEELGGELRFKRGVKRILTKDGRVTGVLLDKGDEVIEAPVVLSTAGALETALITDGIETPELEGNPDVGQMTFVESILCLDVEPRTLGIDKTIVFYNDSDRFEYRPSEDYLDLRSGVICCSNNYAHEQPLPEGILRLTNIASYARWNELSCPDGGHRTDMRSPAAYTDLKAQWFARQQDKLLTMLPDFRAHVTATDVFTPTTIYYYTRHLNGAVYGSPNKVKSGLTPVDGLFLAGTDQGFLGIVGAMLSGISIANARILMAGA